VCVCVCAGAFACVRVCVCVCVVMGNACPDGSTLESVRSPKRKIPRQRNPSLGFCWKEELRFHTDTPIVNSGGYCYFILNHNCCHWQHPNDTSRKAVKYAM
jgi:hypothetical protein